MTGTVSMARRLGGVAAAAALLAGCASEPTPAPTPVAVAAPPVIDPPPLALPPLPNAMAHDTCGASALGGVVGRPRTSIPIPVDLTRRRVVCTTCPRTQEFRPDRQTILYDLQTGKVTAVTCG